MRIEITVPRLGWSMEEGKFVGWLKAEGERVRKGDLLFALEGDKATQEIECFDEGILTLHPESPSPGDVVAVGQVLGSLIAEETGNSEIAPRHSIESPVSISIPTIVPEPLISRPARNDDDIPARSQPKVRATPRAKRRAQELGIRWQDLKGSGRENRIRERDVVFHAESRANASTSRGAASGIRKTIAERMVASHSQTAPVTLFTTADATNLLNLRQQLKATATDRDHLPSVTDLLIKLTALSLVDHRLLNSSWDHGVITEHSEVHIGVAVDHPDGLLVPVLRDVDKTPVRLLAGQSRELFDRARFSGRLRAADLQGGTFTVTNLGTLGIDGFTPIINPPQAAILGVGRIQKQPVWQDTQFVPRDILSLSLTFDHRIVNGAPAARFQTLVKAIENSAGRLVS